MGGGVVKAKMINLRVVVNKKKKKVQRRRRVARRHRARTALESEKRKRSEVLFAFDPNGRPHAVTLGTRFTRGRAFTVA